MNWKYYKRWNDIEEILAAFRRWKREDTEKIFIVSPFSKKPMYIKFSQKKNFILYSLWIWGVYFHHTYEISIIRWQNDGDIFKLMEWDN